MLNTQNAFESVRRDGINEGKSEVVRNLLNNADFSIENIAALASVPVDFVFGCQFHMCDNC
ncbi:hypothetical protein SAMN05421740_112141 [Parapedobacter koreensis]|uniref:Uncharacterized protein n=1 Tax=Parapedobacter koreensis TaxID=332977 RepID=A0A1H7TWL1_9SPHI|nr:hypothetical protein SAMN05421740_112141 [Parapedobacter koreensis]